MTPSAKFKIGARIHSSGRAPAGFNGFFSREAWRFVVVQNVVANLGETATDFPRDLVKAPFLQDRNVRSQVANLSGCLHGLWSFLLPCEYRNHTINYDVQHNPNQFRNRINYYHERECNLIRKPEGAQETASGARAARPLRPSVAKEAAIENAATKPRSTRLNGRPINVPMNTVATIKYRMVPNRMVAKPRGIKRSHISRLIFRSSFNASNAMGMQISVLRVDAPSVIGFRKQQTLRRGPHVATTQKPIRRTTTGIRKQRPNALGAMPIYRHQEAEPIKNHDADGLDVSQRAENRMPGLALGHYHSNAKDNPEYQHTQHAVVRRKRCEYVGRNDRKKSGFTARDARSFVHPRTRNG